MEGNHRQMHPLSIAVALTILLVSAPQSRADAINNAFNDAIALFERAAPRLSSVHQGVDIGAFRDALTLGQFSSGYWGRDITLSITEQTSANGSCANYAAFVRIPPQEGHIEMTFCPEFSTHGTPTLRRLTVLHEMVHVVAGADECGAMAFASAVEYAATGSFTGVERYWRANQCDRSGFALP